MLRTTPRTQPAHYAENAGFPAKAHGQAQDRLRLIEADLARIIGRAMRVPDHEAALEPIPAALTHAGRIATYDPMSALPSVAAVSTGQMEAAVNAVLAGTAAPVTAAAYSPTLAAAKMALGAGVIAAGFAIAVAGRVAAGDGYQGVFAYDPAGPGAYEGEGLGFVDHLGRSFRRVHDGIINVGWFGTDAAAVQAALNVGGRILFPPVNHVVDATLVPVAGAHIVGWGATLSYAASWADGAAFFDFSVPNVTIEGLAFAGGGNWSGAAFRNPYAAGNSVGFANNHYGIRWSNTTNIKVFGCTFSGLGNGLQPINASNCSIIGNVFDTIGNAAINTDMLSDSEIAGNKIRNVLGNLTAAGDTATANSKFADGIYIYRCANVSMHDNVITNCIRIGIVLEGDAVTLNSRVVIHSNVITNMNSCRGTEYNAAIWFEPGKSDDTCAAIGNLLDNTGFIAGSHAAYGIQIADALAAHNKIYGFSIGIGGTNFEARNNVVRRNTYGITVGENQAAGKASTIAGNDVSANLRIGIDVDKSHGLITIIANVITDNGAAGDFAGIRVLRYYNDQTVAIQGNVFVSSANAGAAAGQLYGILAVNGGDFTYTQNFITNNQFFFTGTGFAAYPANIGQTPMTMGYDNTADPVFAIEIVNEPFANNYNSKQPQTQDFTPP